MEEKKRDSYGRRERKDERKGQQKERERRGCRKREWNGGRIEMEEKKRDPWKK